MDIYVCNLSLQLYNLQINKATKRYSSYFRVLLIPPPCFVKLSCNPLTKRTYKNNVDIYSFCMM